MARGLADAASDVELDVSWTAPPSSADRQAAVEGSGFAREHVPLADVTHVREAFELRRVV